MKENAKQYLNQLCYSAPHRCVGGAGNRMATDFVAEKFAAFGFEVSQPEFDCMDWHAGDLQLSAGGQDFEAHISPYSLGCDLDAPLRVVSTVDELKGLDCKGDLLLVMGELTKEQLMPKNFVFYNPEHHQHMLRLLEHKQPAAILAATTSDPGVAGGISPFPLIEDGDFNIPNGYMTAQEGNRLAQLAGKRVSIYMQANRNLAKGVNVVATRGKEPEQRVVVCAHIDGKLGTPAAIDNASGVVALLLLAELLQDYDEELTIELLAVNGEDYYAVSGEMLYVEQNQDIFDQIKLMVNIDAAGYIKGPTAYSFYGLQDEVEEKVTEVFSKFPGLSPGEQWYQSDHGIFVQRGVPAVAITSQEFTYLTNEITHTQRDQAEIVEVTKLVEIAQALNTLLRWHLPLSNSNSH